MENSRSCDKSMVEEASRNCNVIAEVVEGQQQEGNSLREKENRNNSIE